MKRIILLNGPPRSGKDTAALILAESIGAMQDKMSWPLKNGVSGILNTTFSALEEKKEEVIPALGVSFRQAQIDMSEKFMKKVYGEDIFGRLLVGRIRESPWYDLWCISDCGFQVELRAVAKAFPGQVALLRLHRSGCSFDGDSRQWVYGAAEGIYERDVVNDGNMDSFGGNLMRALRPWWKLM